MPDSVREHIDSFLMPSDPHGGIVRAAEILADHAPDNAELQQALGMVEGWLRRQWDPLPDGDREGALAIAYVRATDALRRGNPDLFIHIDTALTPRSAQTLDELPPDFVELLIRECESRLQRGDEALDRRLRGAESGIAWIADQLVQRCEGLLAYTSHGYGKDKPGGTFDDAGRELCARIFTIVIILQAQEPLILQSLVTKGRPREEPEPPAPLPQDGPEP